MSQLGEAKGDKFRFKKNQIGFLDILLSSKPEVKTDRGFKEFREKIRKFSGVKPKSPSPLFQGTLRGYQKEGLGWLFFLREFGLGGCLADDMGLGKTIQVLALLQMVHGEKENGSATNLVVVPSSLLFNWKEEAGRFTPDLRIFLHGGPGRKKPGEHFKEFDLVLTTYGTLRSDILLFQEIPFHYVILDEAQAIKNSNSQTSKSVRLLQAAHRLALSGTPIENHVGELWSLFEFLNPGILGKKTGFKRGTAAKKTGLEERRILAGAVKPFILRRTKEVVATDLPQKTEQTIYCEMKPSQRKVYEELKKHYQFSLVKNVKEKGVDTNRFQILEALLRLRQVACHPALIKDEMAKTSSCKLDTLRESLKEVVEEGHKALVFSQFTSFLALVKKELDKDGIKYQYLDGSTRDRQERVELFQNDESYSLFLISLRAGGVGLNLTRAEYVFILDPWWNPAVEAQAIDRAHRIGQTRNIFAYRLICKDTVEERVLALQKGKKELADSIISEDKSVLQGLQVEDLEFLLS
ncbi:MAG: DEAD/DEAH box helicase [Nitrospinota bacterium]